MLDRGGNFSYVEAVLSCQGFLYRLHCAVSALKAHKPELLDQTPKNYVITSKHTLTSCQM